MNAKVKTLLQIRMGGCGCLVGAVVQDNNRILLCWGGARMEPGSAPLSEDEHSFKCRHRRSVLAGADAVKAVALHQPGSHPKGLLPQPARPLRRFQG